MILLYSSTETVNPKNLLSFETESLHTGNAEKLLNNSTVILNKKGIYEVSFKAIVKPYVFTDVKVDLSLVRNVFQVSESRVSAYLGNINDTTSLNFTVPIESDGSTCISVKSLSDFPFNVLDSELFVKRLS